MTGRRYCWISRWDRQMRLAKVLGGDRPGEALEIQGDAFAMLARHGGDAETWKLARTAYTAATIEWKNRKAVWNTAGRLAGIDKKLAAREVAVTSLTRR